MERTDYNNIIKSMQLSNHWYFAEKEIGADMRYGLFVPSNENIIELMQYEGYFYLAELMKGFEYTKNVNLLYIIAEFFLAKWKSYTHNLEESDYFYQKDELEECLYSSLRTIYRLLKNGEISGNDLKIKRFLQDFKENVDIEKCQGVLNAILKNRGFNVELSEDSLNFIENETNRFYKIRAIFDKYKYTYNDSHSSLTFLTEALKEGIISIKSDGTVKSPFIDEESTFKCDPEVIFMLDEKTQACILKEGIDEGKIIIMEGLDFLKPTSSIVKKLEN